MRGALIHRARLVRSVASDERNEQGEKPMSRTYGEWVPARLMGRGEGGKQRGRGGAAASLVAHADAGYELLIGPKDVLGDPTEPPQASSVYETDCPVLGSPTVHVTGVPEVLTPGVKLIGYRCLANAPEDAS